MYVRMPFGKHRGKLLSDIPASYLVWVLREIGDLEEWLRQEIAAEYRRRMTPHVDLACPLCGTDRGRPAVTTDVVGCWYRELALRFHPDRGGTVSAMQAINEVHERLKELVA